MTNAELGGRLLASVSRSFYLSIRMLPPTLREPIGLAYLLARASDTIADTASVAAETRLKRLADFGRMVATLTSTGLPELQAEIVPMDASERELIAELRPILEWLGGLEGEARREIQKVLRLIIRGQTLDVERFPGATEGEVRALQSSEELEEYTYLVAGCVGEFWTRVCFLRLRNYSAMDVDDLCRLGGRFGKALQFVNILRDLPADLRNGRCYLPEDELRVAGLNPAELLEEGAKARPLCERWRTRAEDLLSSGREYICAIRPFRARAACYLPWRLGEATLTLLREAPPLETPTRVKVSRGLVYATLARSMMVGMSNAALDGAPQSFEEARG